MQELFKWFLKTHMQQQSFYQHYAPNPTIEEINEAAAKIQANYPNKNIALIASHLYHTMKEVTADSKIVPALTYYQIINKIRVPNVTPSIKNQADEEKYKLKQAVIESFVNRGYGMSEFRQYIIGINFPTKVGYKKYAACVTSLVTEAFKALQKCVQTNCSVVSEPLSKPDVRILYSILLNLRQLVGKQAQGQQYFFVYSIFLRSIYNLSEQAVEVSLMSVYRTYQAILRLLMIRQKQVDPLRSDQKQKLSIFKQQSQKMFIRKQSNQITQSVQRTQNKTVVKRWGQQSENQLALFFVELQDIGKVRQRYRQIYGCITMFENMVTLRSYLYKIIRKSLRRAQKLGRVYGQNFSKQTIQMINLRQDERYVQYVLTSPQFMKSRVLLCKMHNSKQKDFNLIKEIGQAISEGLSLRANTKRNILNKI